MKKLILLLLLTISTQIYSQHLNSVGINLSIPYNSENKTVSCQKSVPEAIIAFLESTDYESAVRNAISLGGDSDTQGCIAGSIAEAFYGFPEKYKEIVEQKLDKFLLSILNKFNKQ